MKRFINKRDSIPHATGLMHRNLAHHSFMQRYPREAFRQIWLYGLALKVRADKRPKLSPGSKRWRSAEAVHCDFRGQLCASRKVFAESTAAKNVVKVKGLIDERSNGICPTQPIDRYTGLSRIYFE
jgi:hypothetical protein